MRLNPHLVRIFVAHAALTALLIAARFVIAQISSQRLAPLVTSPIRIHRHSRNCRFPSRSRQSAAPSRACSSN